MKLTVAGKNVEITEDIKNHLDQKMGKIVKGLEDHADIHVVLAKEKRRYMVEITLKKKGLSAHSKEETDSLYASMDQALGKIEIQLKKHKDRAISRKMKGNKAEKEKMGA